VENLLIAFYGLYGGLRNNSTIQHFIGEILFSKGVKPAFSGFVVQAPVSLTGLRKIKIIKFVTTIS
jgi:hypothetical protein